MPKRRVRRHSVTQPEDQSIRLIPLTQGQNAIVDASDWEFLMRWNWHARWDHHTKSFYAERIEYEKSGNGSYRRIFHHMHRVVLGCSPQMQCDHINHDTLDNRRENLRECTCSQNNRNRKIMANSTNPYKGVCRCGSKWRARIRVDGRKIHLGLFASAAEAAAVYDKVCENFWS